MAEACKRTKNGIATNDYTVIVRAALDPITSLREGAKCDAFTVMKIKLWKDILRFLCRS